VLLAVPLVLRALVGLRPLYTRVRPLPEAAS
jgi:hypothetical protein